MEKGVIYLMTTAVTGLIKIGRTQTTNYEERMRFLEANGYYNVSGLKRFFAIVVTDYKSKENLLIEIFSKHQVAQSELFALNIKIVQKLLLSFEGEVIYSTQSKKDQASQKNSHMRKTRNFFTFSKKGIKKGELIYFRVDPQITARVVDEREVEYHGKIWKLSPLALHLYENKNMSNKSKSFQGADHWLYQKQRLTTLPDVRENK